MLVGVSALLGAATAANPALAGTTNAQNGGEDAAGSNLGRVDSAASKSDPAGRSDAHSVLASSDCEDRVDGQSNKNHKTGSVGTRFLIEAPGQDSALDYVNYYIKVLGIGLCPASGVWRRGCGAERGPAAPYPSPDRR